MTNARNFPRLTAFLGHCLAFLLVSVALVACTPDKQEKEDVRIRAIPGEPFFPPSDTDRDRGYFSERLLLDFDSSPFLSSASYGFFRLGDYLSYATNQGHRQKGSVRVSNRTANWQGPLITLPPLKGKSYTASAWINLINAERTANVKLILMQVSDEDAVSMPLAEIEATPRTWQKVEGQIVGTKTDNSISVLRMEVEGSDIDYLVDDILIEEAALASELEEKLEREAPVRPASSAARFISNGDVEEGLEPWTHQGGKITRSRQYAHSGEYSLLISERKLEWHAPMMTVSGLQDNKLYHFSIFARLVEGFPADTAQLTLKQMIDGKPIFTAIANSRVSNSGWTEIAGSISASNFSISGQVSVYLECGNPIASYYVDSLTVEEQ